MMGVTKNRFTFPPYTKSKPDKRMKQFSDMGKQTMQDSDH